jgi:putative PIN family toxin of toxin-antitoxin system
MAKIVLDANVIISAAFGGKPLEAVTMALTKHEVYLTESVVAELMGVLAKLSKRLSSEQMAFLQDKMRELVAMARVVPISSSIMLSRDPNDDHYLSLCKETKADFLVTGDKDLLTISTKALQKNDIMTRIVTPHDFLSEE